MIKPIRCEEDAVELAVRCAPSAACASALRRGNFSCKQDNEGVWYLDVQGRVRTWGIKLMPCDKKQTYKIEVSYDSCQ